MLVKEYVDELRREWKQMWRSRVEDRVRAEGIADKSYKDLFVERGLILLATKDFKSPDFHDILKRHLTREEIRRYYQDPISGGIGKFIRENIKGIGNSKELRRRQVRKESKDLKKNRQKRHGGRGWLRISMVKG